MIEPITLARPYARAAFEYGRAAGTLDSWSLALGELAAVAGEQRVVSVLNDPALTGERRAQVLSDLVGDSVAPPVKNFVRIMAENDRLALLPEVAGLFADMKQQLEATIAVEVTSAFDMSDAELSALSESMAKKLDRSVSIKSHTDPSLLGGAVIRAGDLVIDGSVRGRLNKLAGSLTP